MKGNHEILLYIAYNLVNQNQDFTIQAIEQNLQWVKCDKFDIETEIIWLISNGYIIRDGKRKYCFTDLGSSEAFRINEQKNKDDFNFKINRYTDSMAYLDFCEELYGYRIYMFNMMDKVQLDYLFNKVQILNSDTVLDIGCGTGSILNCLVEKYQCSGVGIDQLEKDVVFKNGKMISYINGNIDNLDEYSIESNIILAVDSIYFSSNLDRLIQSLAKYKSNKSYLYYSQYIFDETTKDRSVLHADNTRLAQSLQKNRVAYKTIEYSNNEYSIYEKGINVLQKYKNDFENEGNFDIYESKYKECEGGKKLYDNGLASRYLYILE